MKTVGDPSMSDKRFCVKKPCKECPFARSTTPGELGGSDPTVYIGQAMGPFWLPCHLHTEYSDPNWKQDTAKPQCAGAAMYRSLVGVDRLMPPSLHRLEGDPELVFSSPAELLAHHKKISIEDAEKILLIDPPEWLMLLEMKKAAMVGWLKKEAV
jgi:hypothetical protein